MPTHEDLTRPQAVKGSGNRAFGAVITIVLAIFGLWPLIGGGALRPSLLIAAVVLLAITLVAPALLRIPNRLWFRFGMLLNRLVSPVVLAFLFYVVVTPMAMLMRSVRKDSLRLRQKHGDEGYWIKRDPPGPKPESMSDQF
jgi:large-conductance mechanosensitive channel